MLNFLFPEDRLQRRYLGNAVRRTLKVKSRDDVHSNSPIFFKKSSLSLNNDTSKLDELTCNISVFHSA